jgi:hypothetical protein
VLANLPTKWTPPQLAAGVLPAHAQTSEPPEPPPPPPPLTLACSDWTGDTGSSFTTGCDVTPPTGGVSLGAVVRFYDGPSLDVTNPPVVVSTDGSGHASLVIGPPFYADTLMTITWTFADGTGTLVCSIPLR